MTETDAEGISGIRMYHMLFCIHQIQAVLWSLDIFIPYPPIP